MKSSVYEIRNIVTGSRYIGSAKSFLARRNRHLWELRNNRHPNKHLQHSYEKHGENNFVVSPLLFCSIDNLLLYEQICIDNLSPEYNLTPTAGSLLGYKHSDESKEKIRKASTGKKHSDESRAKMSASRIGNKNCVGRKVSSETRKKIGEKHIGRKMPEFLKKKLSDLNKGRTHTPEVRKIISETQKLRWQKHREREVYTCK